MSRLRILKEYSGRNTNEQVIAPGEYDADDPRLFGLADYLVANEPARAVWLVDDVLVPETVTLTHDEAVEGGWLPGDDTLVETFTLAHEEAMDALGRDLPDAPPAKPARKPKG